MTDLAGRPPLGQKTGKPPKKPRAPIPKQSAKRKAYMASQARVDGLAHMMWVKDQRCVCCNAPPPSEAHHVTGDGFPRNDMRTIPLCPPCHTGPHGYHKAKRAWVARHGPDYGFLPRVEALIRQATHTDTARPYRFP